MQRGWSWLKVADNTVDGPNILQLVFPNSFELGFHQSQLVQGLFISHSIVGIVHRWVWGGPEGVLSPTQFDNTAFHVFVYLLR